MIIRSTFSILRPAAPMRLAGSLFLAALFAGCSNREIRVYRVAKEQHQPPSPTASTHVHASRPAIHWQLPKGWEALPPGEMRLGDFRVHDVNGAQAEVTIVPLPGQAGRDVDNVNRWRGQVGLEPIAEEQLAEQSEPVAVAGHSARLYQMSGMSADDEKKRILAVILRRGETAWFFKMIGDDALVRREEATFKQFLKTISYEGDAHSEPATPGVAQSTAEPGKLNWKVPADWREQPPGQMQIAKFTLADNAEVTVAAFAGEVGGTLANINRWRGQLGRPPVDAAELPSLTTSFEAGGAPATMVDITAEDKQRRLVAVIVPRGEKTWFYKLLGDEPAVASAKNRLVEFVKSAD